MSKSTKRKYIESHWLVFAIKGAIAMIAGLCMMFTARDDTRYLTQIVSWTMMGLALLEILNVIHRKRRQRTLLIPLIVGIIELITGASLMLTIDYNASVDGNIAARILILSAYALYASLCSIIVGFRSFDNLTDRFIWVVDGIVGCILAFIMFADNGLSATTHIKIFGTFLMVKGLTDLFFGVHSRDEMKELHAEKALRRKNRKE